MSETSEDVVILSRQFSVELVNGSHDVRISDGNGRKGGNARGRGGNAFRIRWTNRTGLKCRLNFRAWIVKSNGDLVEEEFWPFEEPARPDNGSRSDLDIPAFEGGNSPGRREARLKDFNDRVVLKYDVAVDPDRADGPVAELDPMIIVER